MSLMKKHAKKKIKTKDIFDRYLVNDLTGADSSKTIDIFSNLNATSFLDLARKHKLKERQISTLIGFKDEFFVYTLICQIISELHLEDQFYCKKVTASEWRGLSARMIKFHYSDLILTVGGDCVIFRKSNDKPVMIIECKEYIDMIRMKELIGESQVIKGSISNSKNLLAGITFCVFSEVLELTAGWAYLLNNSDLAKSIDNIFIIRDGKRKDRKNKPVKENLLQFREYITKFLQNAR